MKWDKRPCPFSKFDAESFVAWAQRHYHRKWADIKVLVSRSGLLTYPVPEIQGPPWRKPELYIAAAFVVMIDDTPDIVREKLRLMKVKKQEAIEESTLRVMGPREVRSSGRDYFVSFGARARSMSPPERVVAGDF